MMSENGPAPPRLETDASRKVLLPIAGLLGGLAVGGLRSWLAEADELTAVALTIAGGVVGSALGMTAVLAQLFPLRTLGIGSVKGLLALAALSAVLLWFVLGYLRILLRNP